MTAEAVAPVVAAAIVGYLVGAIPLPYLIVRFASGEDLRSVHTGNVGVMNSASVLGRRIGFGVLLAELFKGMACAWLGSLIGGYAGAWVALVAGVFGANWSIYLRGSGGRGNTTFGGGLIAIAPVLFVALGAIFFAGRAATGSAFVAARLNIILMPVVFAIYGWLRFHEPRIALLHGAGGLACAAIFRVKHSRETDDHMALLESGRLPRDHGDTTKADSG